MPIIPQTHHPTPATGTGRSKHRKRSPKTLAHSTKATPSPELPCARRTVPAMPVIDNPPKSPSPTPPLNHQRPFLTTAHPGRQRDRTGASIGSDHQNPSRTARKQRPPPSLPARAGPIPRSPAPKTCPPRFFTFPASPEFPIIIIITPMTFPLLSRIHRDAHRGSIRACQIVVLLSLLTAGCDPSGSTKTLAPQSPKTQAAADPSTALILAAVDNGFHRVPIALTTDYGFLVVNAGDDEHPIPSVSVGFRSERRIISCGSLAEFEAALRTVPPGSTIHRHERCLMPASRGLAEEFLAGIEPTLSRVGISVAPEPVITCLCGR